MSIARILSAPFRALGYVLRTLFGDVRWEPAPWQRRTGAFVAARPWQVAGTLAALALVGYGAYWWAQRPKPVDPAALTVDVYAPSATIYTDTPPTVDALVVTFSGSAAPIEAVGAGASGIALDPPLAGAWTWTTDQRLEFKPATDWPIGQHYAVRFDVPKAFAPTTRLVDAKYEFDTAKFAAQLASSEFYQDPEDATLKKGAYEFHFSHPVDGDAFEKLLALEMVDGAGTKQTAPGVTISYDELRLKAYVQTKPLTVPENGGSLALTLKAGAKSSLGGAAATDDVKGHVALPSLYSVRVDDVTASLTDNERYEPEQVLVVEFNDSMRDEEVARLAALYLLPEVNPKLSAKDQTIPYPWSADDVDEKVLGAAERIDLVPLPGEREYVPVHSFKYRAPPGRYVYFRLPKGLKSFGGFKMGQAHAQVLNVPEYPELLRFVGDGALLSLKGERRVTAVSRNVPGLKIEIARVLPAQLQHLVKYNSGSFGAPTFYQIEADSLTERFVKRVPLPHDDPSKTHYEGVDLGEYFADGRHGVFLLSLYRDDPTVPDPIEGGPTEEPEWTPEPIDQRLVVLTDLGVLAKTALDGSRSVFVQSLAHGEPVAGATVSVVARNGERVVERTTGGYGAVELPSLAGFKREKQPVLLAVQSGADLSFLPLDDYSRRVDLSRFDVGGEVNAADPGDLKAYLFSDRGLYRPGDTIHLGLIVRTASWAGTLAGVPLELVLTDPRGSVAKRERLALGPVGFEAVEHTPADTAPTGNWEATLYLVGPDDALTSLGSTTVQVREFLPDRLKVRAALSSESVDGWVRPEELTAKVNVQNLFGTPAQDRRVTASVLLQPQLPSFRTFPDHRFHDPQAAKEGFSEALDDGTTDAEGNVEFALGLEQYERATYRLRFLAQAFEAGAGRGVAADTAQLVSSNAFLVGIKALDELGYVQRGAARKVNVVAIGPDGAARAAPGSRQVLVERRWVSVLTKQDSGLFKYVSQLRLDTRTDTPLALAAGGNDLTLPTQTPGDYTLEIRDAADVVLNRVDFAVADANVARSLDRNAELKLTLSKADYAPGENVEISIRAPYAGAGLITIERDRVYAHRWFRAETTASVQTIAVPEGIEGNAYVHVQFLRDPASDEIFTSPLSYGVAPFSIDRSARRLPPRLTVPDKVKPGATAAFTVAVDEPARVVVFAVDEGILQVARYQLGDPLEHFFRKKMLQVDTAQILDLVLPEFSKLAGMAAPGGDAEGALAKHLNPFKRKGEKPAVYWSGLIDVEATHTFEYTVPEHFNGSLRVMTVAVAPQRIGVAQASTLVRGDFVLTPNVPTQVAPGDEFDVTVGVANTIDQGSVPAGKPAIAVKLVLPPSLTAVGPTTQTLEIAAGNESSARFRVKAGDALGAPLLRFEASSGAYRAQRSIDLSLRPSVAYRHDVTIGNSAKLARIEPLRTMYDEHAKREARTSVSPLVVATGLGAYLADYPHYCTEQLLSQAIPALVFARRPELGATVDRDPAAAFGGIVDVLRSRQSGSGGFGLWVATPDPQPFVSAYAGLYLVEAQDRGFAVPEDLLTATNDYLAELAADSAQSDLSGLRTRALAVYLLTRQGRTTTNLLATVQQQLEKNAPKTWKQDAAAALVAASYKLLKQDKAARELIDGPLVRLGDLSLEASPEFADYYDGGIASAWTVLLVAKHFPDERKRIDAAALGRLLEPAKRGWYNTLSSGLTILALDAYATSGGAVPVPELAYEVAKATTPFGEAQGIVRRGVFPGEARALLVTPPADTTAWYAISQAGYDRVLPAATQNKGVEVVRDYLDASGNKIAKLTVGDEVTVRVRLRALGADARGDIAIVDLLPGAFEVVMQQPPLAEDADGTTPPPAATVALPASTLYADYVDVREDRVVVYATATAKVTELLYRIKATAVGKFVVPPPYAESMYQRDIYAQGGPAGSLEVVAP